MDGRVLWIVKCPKYIHEGHDAGVAAIHWQYFLFSTSMISSSIVVQKRNTLAIYDKFTSFSEKNNCTQILRRVRLCLVKSSPRICRFHGRNIRKSEENQGHCGQEPMYVYVQPSQKIKMTEALVMHLPRSLAPIEFSLRAIRNWSHDGAEVSDKQTIKGNQPMKATHLMNIHGSCHSTMALIFSNLRTFLMWKQQILVHDLAQHNKCTLVKICVQLVLSESDSNLSQMAKVLPI